ANRTRAWPFDDVRRQRQPLLPPGSSIPESPAAMIHFPETAEAAAAAAAISTICHRRRRAPAAAASVAAAGPSSACPRAGGPHALHYPARFPRTRARHHHQQQQQQRKQQRQHRHRSETPE
ncbi:unnamed protein product, partial [Ectocarpus sp. 6 AP-2014]